ncbi:MAG TPA: hypothetical protein VFB79_03130 [Candidatus Angelobacter sp.]|nr:hypothetical protein [Candidatus Angelobacter sp.]
MARVGYNPEMNKQNLPLKSQARTEGGSFRFRVKEFGDGTPFITAEPQHITTTLVGNEAFMSFELNRGTTLAEAERIAEYLNNHISMVTYTIFGDHPMFRAVPPNGKS